MEGVREKERQGGGGGEEGEREGGRGVLADPAGLNVIEDGWMEDSVWSLLCVGCCHTSAPV